MTSNASEKKFYPHWICSDCGNKYGNRQCGIATWHFDKCDLCGKETSVTEPRDYGHLKASSLLMLEGKGR